LSVVAAFASRANTRYVLAARCFAAYESALARPAQRPGTACGYDPFVATWCWVTNRPKYVNMADLTALVAANRHPSGQPGGGEKEPVWDVIELLFFAYRDFISEPDDALAKIGFGRAHHRVLHFVNRTPGLKVAELLDILKITKQSLGRVLKQLVDQGYVLQKEGASDRRQRLLYVTARGEALAMKLAALQMARVSGALAELGPNAHDAACRLLTAMIDPDNRDGVLKLIARADRARRQRA
jgi:DNA-binding MarR family transcriptional regulator